MTFVFKDLCGIRGFRAPLGLAVNRAPVLVVFDRHPALDTNTDALTRLVGVLPSQQLFQKAHLHLIDCLPLRRDEGRFRSTKNFWVFGQICG